MALVKNQLINFPLVNDPNMMGESPILTQKETGKFFISHLRNELVKKSLPVPDFLPEINTYQIKIFLDCANEFSKSSLNNWIEEQAYNVDLESLNQITLNSLLKDLLRTRDNRIRSTLERILMVFYFTSHIYLRIYEDVQPNRRPLYFERIFSWTYGFMINEVASFVQKNQSWFEILISHRNIKRPFIDYKCLSASIFCLAIATVLIFTYLKIRK